MIEDKALLSEYLSETEELLEQLLADLDRLSARPAPGPDVNLVNRLFRAIHSLKGLTGMMGLGEVQSLAHEFEDILDDLRLGQLTLDAEVAAALQEAGAGLAALVGVASRGAASDDDYQRLRELLNAIAARPRQRRKAADELEALALSERERSLLTEVEAHRLRENLAAGRSLYAVCVQFKVDNFDSRYRALAERLESAGELITTLPDSATEPTLIALKLVFATAQKEAEVKRLVEGFAARLSRLAPSAWRRAGQALKVVGRIPRRKAEEGGEGERFTALLPPSFAQEALQPLSASVRVDLARIDDLSGLAHEISIQASKLTSMAEGFLDAAGLGARERFELKQRARRLAREFLQLEERLVELRMVSLAQTFTRASRLAGRLARELGKSVSVEVVGRDTQLDKVIADRIADPIYHILRNAIDHGIELPQARRLAGKSPRGKVRIEAAIEGTRAVIAIADDGRGIDPEEVRRRAVEIGALAPGESLGNEETLRLIFQPGFSTASEVSPVSGRGVGLDAVERAIHDLGGEIRVQSEPGRGARFELAVPTTLVMIPAFIVRVGEWRYAVNVNQIAELLFVEATEVSGRDGRRSIFWRGEHLPLIELRYLLGLGGARMLFGENGANGAGPGDVFPTRVPLLIARYGSRHVAIAVERFERQSEIIVKSLGSLARRLKGVSGAVDLEGGDVALVLDVPGLLLLRSTRA